MPLHRWLAHDLSRKINLYSPLYKPLNKILFIIQNFYLRSLMTGNFFLDLFTSSNIMYKNRHGARAPACPHFCLYFYMPAPACPHYCMYFYMPSNKLSRLARREPIKDIIYTVCCGYQISG
jgi:hypothetical protein